MSPPYPRPGGAPRVIAGPGQVAVGHRAVETIDRREVVLLRLAGFAQQRARAVQQPQCAGCVAGTGGEVEIGAGTFCGVPVAGADCRLHQVR